MHNFLYSCNWYSFDIIEKSQNSWSQTLASLTVRSSHIKKTADQENIQKEMEIWSTQTGGGGQKQFVCVLFWPSGGGTRVLSLSPQHIKPSSIEKVNKVKK